MRTHFTKIENVLESISKLICEWCWTELHWKWKYGYPENINLANAMKSNPIQSMFVVVNEFEQYIVWLQHFNIYQV